MKKSRWVKAMFVLLRVGVLVYLGLLALVFFGQRRFIYLPRKHSLEGMTRQAAEHGFEVWQGKNGYMGWKQVSGSGTAASRLLIVHGNAGCAVDRVGYAGGLRAVEAMDVYILEYPGYGARAGAPSEGSLLAAADEAVEDLRKGGSFYVMGESLGTGVAAYIAGKYPELVRGILLVAPYNNFPAVAAYTMPYFPARWLVRDRFSSDVYLKNYHGPVVMFFAGQDVVVPNRFGHRLYDGYNGPKIFWEVPQAGHNDLLDEPESRWREVVDFWKGRKKI